MPYTGNMDFDYLSDLDDEWCYDLDIHGAQNEPSDEQGGGG